MRRLWFRLLDCGLVDVFDLGFIPIGVTVVFRGVVVLRILRQRLFQIGQRIAVVRAVVQIIAQVIAQVIGGGRTGVQLKPGVATVGTLHVPALDGDDLVRNLVLRTAIWTCQPHSASPRLGGADHILQRS